MFGGLPMKTLADWLATPSGRGAFRDGSMARLHMGDAPPAKSALQERWDPNSNMKQTMDAAEQDIKTRHAHHLAHASASSERCLDDLADRSYL